MFFIKDTDRFLKLSIGTSILLITALVFLYFVFSLVKEERVYHARKYCAPWAMKKSLNDENTSFWDPKEYDDQYERCLREKGIIN